MRILSIMNIKIFVTYNQISINYKINDNKDNKGVSMINSSSKLIGLFG